MKIIFSALLLLCFASCGDTAPPVVALPQATNIEVIVYDTIHKRVRIFDTTYRTKIIVLKKDTIIYQVEMKDTIILIPVYLPRYLRQKIKEGAVTYTIEIK